MLNTLRNVTLTCNVMLMDNVTNNCMECGKDMYGRADRKFCSAACRQKSYRTKRNETVNNSVTAEPFPLDYSPVFYRQEDQFWRTVNILPDMLTTLTAYDGESDYANLGHDERPIASAYPPRTKARAEQDLALGVRLLSEFLESYDEMAANLARMRATAKAILEHHGTV